MNTGLISTRYADSLLQYATSRGEQKAVYDKAKMLAEMYTAMPALRSAVINPSLQRRDKEKILSTACGGNIPSSLLKMFGLILKNEREELLQYIILRFIHLYREKFNIRNGRLTTAVPIDPPTAERFTARIRELVQSEVEMESVVDPAIIGGFVLTLGDLRWDASISGKLTRIKHQIQ